MEAGALPSGLGVRARAITDAQAAASSCAMRVTPLPTPFA
jgi:hypothetical protein